MGVASREAPRPPSFFPTLCLLVLGRLLRHLGAILLIPGRLNVHARGASAYEDCGSPDRAAATRSRLKAAGSSCETDPFIAMAACAFDLADGPFRFTTQPSPHFIPLPFHRPVWHGGILRPSPIVRSMAEIIDVVRDDAGGAAAD